MEAYENIVKRILRSIWNNVEITDFATPVCDMLLEFPDIDLKFLVEVKTARDYTEHFWKEYRETLGMATFMQGAPNIPVVLAVFDEETERLSLGTALCWKHQAPVIIDSVELWELKEENRDSILDEISSADKTIRMLSNTNCKVIKEIRFSLSVDKIDIPAKVLYLRDLSSTYRMNCRVPQNQQEELDRYIYGIPQDEYPNDGLDKSILKAIEAKYADAQPHSSLMLFNTELRKLKARLQNMHRYDIKVDLYEIANNSMCTLPFDLDCYLEFNIGNKTPETYYQTMVNIEKLPSLKEIQTLCNTLHRTDILFI